MNLYDHSDVTISDLSKKLKHKIHKYAGNLETSNSASTDTNS